MPPQRNFEPVISTFPEYEDGTDGSSSTVNVMCIEKSLPPTGCGIVAIPVHTSEASTPALQSVINISEADLEFIKNTCKNFENLALKILI